MLFPCIREGRVQRHGHALLGTTTIASWHGTGDTGDGDRSNWNARIDAASTLQRVSIGWVAGIGIDAYIGRFGVGLAGAIRQTLVVTGGPLAREYLPSLLLRVGGEVGL